MALYTYTAHGPDGRSVEGTVDAPNSGIAVARLRAQGLIVERVRAQEVGGGPPPTSVPDRWPSSEPLFGAGVPLSVLAAFYRQFAALISAGLPIFQALASLEAQAGSGRLGRICAEAQEHVLSGGRLSEVMERHPGVFNALQREMIRAGEIGGMMDATLRRIADYLERELALRRMISRLTMYPKVVATSALFLLGWSFASDGTPAISKLIIGQLGRNQYGPWDYFLDTGFVLLVAIGGYYGVGAAARAGLLRSVGLQEAWERFRLAVPGLGTVVREFALTRFGRALGALYAAGLPVRHALVAAGEASASFALRRAAMSVCASVDQRETLSNAFRLSGAFPSIVVEMVQTGELTGDLDGMLEKMADYLEGDAETKANQYSHIFSAVLYLAVALLIGSAILRFYSGYVGGLGTAAGG